VLYLTPVHMLEGIRRDNKLDVQSKLGSVVCTLIENQFDSN